MSVTYCVVVPFDRAEGGDLVPGEATEAPDREAAKRQAGFCHLKDFRRVATRYDKLASAVALAAVINFWT